MLRITTMLLIAVTLAGCRSFARNERPRMTRSSTARDRDAAPVRDAVPGGHVVLASATQASLTDPPLPLPEPGPGVRRISSGDDAPALPGQVAPAPGDDVPPIPPPTGGNGTPNLDDLDDVRLDDVITSIFESYPMLEAAYRERTIAMGKATSAMGAFDTKLKGDSADQPVGFYRTYRQKIGFEQPIFSGGDAFANYRIGRGQFEPWYEERNTNDGGEFKAGVVLPLLRDRHIDERRADLWKARFGQSAVEPDIRGQLIEFIRQGTFAYWKWVAAGRARRIAEDLVQNAVQRDAGLRARLKEGAIEGITVTDNERLIVSRRAKLVDAERKLEQAAIKLSMFLRDVNGTPIVPGPDALPTEFPDPLPFDPATIPTEIDRALSMRPELAFLEFTRRQAELDLRQANNMYQPVLDAGFIAGQDIGKATSKKRDKSRFELEANLVLEVPLQRRKARGKILQSQGKLAQINAKTRFTRDKIAVEVQTAAVAVAATYRRYEQAKRSLELALIMVRAEVRRFNLGQEKSDLFVLNGREKQAAEAALEVVSALLDHFNALADLRAAIGELPTERTPPEN